MMIHENQDKLSVKTKLFYGIGDIGNAIVNSAIQFFLLIFYTDGALLPPALVGSALLIGKIWDAINDPLFGWFSDRTSSKRFGKRRVFMIFGAIPLGLSIYFVMVRSQRIGSNWHISLGSIHVYSFRYNLDSYQRPILFPYFRAN